MNDSRLRRPARIALVLVIAAACARDVSLTGDEARNSPQAALAMEFLAALRASDVDAMAKLATPEQAAAIRGDAPRPDTELQDMRTMMLADLPADPTALRATVKSVQTHGDRGVVTFETSANSWFVQLDESGGSWKVSGF